MFRRGKYAGGKRVGKGNLVEAVSVCALRLLGFSLLGLADGQRSHLPAAGMGL